MNTLSTLVGRISEMESIDRVIADAAAAAGAVILVTGEAGIGKTRLSMEASIRARDRGFRVIAGRAVEGGAHVPFRPVAEAIAAATRRTGLPDDPILQPYRPALAKLTPEWGDPEDAPASPVAVFEAVLRLFIVLAGDTGLLVTVEDLHWADYDTLALVDYLADQVRGERIVLLGTVRTDEPSSAGELMDRLETRRGARRLDLRRLSRDDVATMTDASLVDLVYERSEGVPFLVEEFTSSYRNRLALVPPSSYRELIRSRLARIDASARRVVEAAAALGIDIDWPYLAAATDADTDDLNRALKQAADVSLMSVADGDRIGFRHALIPETVLAELAPPVRRTALARAAYAVERAYPGLPGEWCERAAELLIGAGEDSRAVELLLESGRRALKRGASATAERALERARSLVAGDRWRTAGVDRLLVQALALQGKADRMCELGEAALSFMRGKVGTLGTPERLADVHLRIAEGLLGTARFADAGPHIESASVMAGEAEDLSVQARALSLQALLRLEDRDVEAARAIADRLRRLAGMDDDDTLRVDGRIALAGGEFDLARECFARSLWAADRAGNLVGRIRALLDIAELDELTTGTLDAILEAADLAAHAESMIVQVDVARRASALHMARHEVAEAEAALDDAFALCEAFVVPPPAQLHVLRAELAGFRGDTRAAREAGGRSIAADGRCAADAAAAVALAHLAHDERDRARAAIDGVPLPHRSRWITDVLDATREPPEVFAWRHHYFHRVAATDVDALQRALAFFDEQGHGRIAAGCRGALTRAGVRVPRRPRGGEEIPGSLAGLGITGREADVLRLVSDGSTNREIAGTLVVSPRTVESHVASLMRKTGAKTRAALAAFARDAEADQGG